jgi:aldehyde dehydrogenase (NAD+)
LALYYFGNQKIGNRVLNETSSGGACINDVLIQVTNHHLPFGGVGNSGIGAYHGHKSFETFSHYKAIVSSSKTIDFSFKYVPFKFLKWIKKVI